MAHIKSSWGIEVGTAGIKALKLVSTDGVVKVESWAVVPYKQILSAPDVNASEMIRLAMQEFQAKHVLGDASVVVSVPGSMAFARFATLPPVEPKRLQEIVRFEAIQQIPFPIEEVEWDYQMFQQADMPDVKVGIFAIVKERVIEFLANLSACGVEVDKITLSSVAVYNAFSYDHELAGVKGGCRAYLDVGTNSTDVIMVEDDMPWFRTFPMGGHQLTETLAKQLKISYAKAEEEKLGVATSRMGKQMLQSMRGSVMDLGGEIDRSFSFYLQHVNRGSQVKKVVAVGSTVQLPGLQKFLSQSLPVEVERLESFKRIELKGRQAADFVGDSPQLVTAYGLALQGIGLARLEVNLLPRSVQYDRMWKAKQAWFLGAAALLLAMALVTVFSYIIRRSSLPDLSRPDPAHAKIIGDSKELVTALQNVKLADDRPKVQALAGLLQYRDLYPKALADTAQVLAGMNQALEQPDKVQGLSAKTVADIKAMSDERRKAAHFAVQGVKYDYLPGAPAPANAPGSPGTLRVTMTGRCGLNETMIIDLVKKSVEPWLTENALRADRPYVLTFDYKSNVFAEKAAGVAGDAGGRGGSFSLPGLPPSGGGGLGSGSSVTMDDIFPPRSASPGEAQTSFRVTWNLVLLAPDQAALAAAGKLPTVTPPPPPPTNP